VNHVPLTRFYTVRGKYGLWARIWITDDGCFTCLSDHGNYGYWWSHPGCEFREFLCGVDDGYLTTKLSAGEKELDAESTTRRVRDTILRQRREGALDRDEAQNEWDLWRETAFEDEFSRNEWYSHTRLGDAYEYMVYRPPIQVQMFVKHLWPLFVEQLRAELAAEAA